VSINWRALIIIVIIIMMGLVLISSPPEIKTYEIPEPREGLIVSARSDNAFLFLFYEHPDEGPCPLCQYDTLYSNELYIYALSYTNATYENLTLHMYRLEERTVGNETILVKVDVQNITITLTLTRFKMVENKIELPTHHKKYTCEIFTASGRKIFTFYHETHPIFLPAKRYTLGSLFMDRLGYILGAVVVCFIALGACRFTIDKRKIVPRMSLGTGLWLITIMAIMIYVSARVLIYTFGLLNVLWTYAPIGAAAYLFGFALMKPPSKTIYFMRTVDATEPTKELMAIEVIEKDGKLWVADIGWKDFIFGRKTEVRIEGKPKWHWKILNSDDIMYIFKDIQEDGNIIRVELEGIHEIDVDRWMSDLKSVESIAREKEYFRKRLLDEIAQKETEIDKRVLEFIKNYEKILLMEEERYEREQ